MILRNNVDNILLKMKYKKINLFDVILGLIILTAKCNTYMERWIQNERSI